MPLPVSPTRCSNSTFDRSIINTATSSNNNRARKASRHCCCCYVLLLLRRYCCFFFSRPEMHVLCDRCDSEAALPVAVLRSPRLRAETLPALRSSDGVAPRHRQATSIRQASTSIAKHRSHVPSTAQVRATLQHFTINRMRPSNFKTSRLQRCPSGCAQPLAKMPRDECPRGKEVCEETQARKGQALKAKSSTMEPTACTAHPTCPMPPRTYNSVVRT